MNNQATKKELSDTHYLVGNTLCWACEPESKVMTLSCGKHFIANDDWEPAMDSLETWLVSLGCTKLIITTEGATPTRAQFKMMRERFNEIPMEKKACQVSTNLSSLELTLSKFAATLNNALNNEIEFSNVDSVDEALVRLDVPAEHHAKLKILVRKCKSNLASGG